jgi:2-aminoadipate transaminase
MSADGRRHSRCGTGKQVSDAHTSTFAWANAGQYLKVWRMLGALARVRNVCGECATAMGQALKRELGSAIEFTQPQGGLFFSARLTGAIGKLKDTSEPAKRAIGIPRNPVDESAPAMRRNA